MFHRIHQKLGTAGLIIAVVALIAVLGGTALAASGALSGKQKKEVEKIAKKFAGKPGAPGAVGTNGTNGKDGAEGKAGANGTNGKSIVIGNTAPGCGVAAGHTIEVEGSGVKSNVCDGEEGSPWTAGGTLPSKQTETGTWGGSSNDPENNNFWPISFTIPLETAPDENHVFHFNQTRTENQEFGTSGCLGIVNGTPTAPAGALCVYTQHESQINNIQYIAQPSEAPGSVTTGAFVVVTPEEAPNRIFGVWAVTAP